MREIEETLTPARYQLDSIALVSQQVGTYTESSFFVVIYEEKNSYLGLTDGPDQVYQ
jgi:hypothetical protein